MTVITNPGFTVPIGRVKDAQGKLFPLYISQEWQIFFQSLLQRTGGSETDRIGDLEEANVLMFSLADNSSDRLARMNRDTLVSHAASLKEIEFLGAFSWQ